MRSIEALHLPAVLMGVSEVELLGRGPLADLGVAIEAFES